MVTLKKEKKLLTVNIWKLKKSFSKPSILVFKEIVQQLKVCLGGCTITSKSKINVLLNFFITPGPLRELSTQQNFKILAFEANSALPHEKMDFKTCFLFKKVSNVSTTNEKYLVYYMCIFTLTSCISKDQNVIWDLFSRLRPSSEWNRNSLVV